MIELLRKSGDEIIRVGIVLIMMLTTVMPVEIRWMGCETWIIYSIPALFVFGFSMLIWHKQKFDWTLTDIIAGVWFAYYIGRAWIGKEWPCQMEFLKTTELFLLYVGFRMAFHGTKISAWVLIGCILAFGCYEAWLGLSQMYGDERSRHNLFALTGSFLTPGPYSAYLMMGVVIGLAALKELPDTPIVKKIPDMLSMKKVTEGIPKKLRALSGEMKSIKLKMTIRSSFLISVRASESKDDIMTVMRCCVRAFDAVPTLCFTSSWAITTAICHTTTLLSKHTSKHLP